MKQAVMIAAMLFFCIYGFAQSTGNYSFGHGAGSYAEISGGTSLGSETTSDQRFVDPATPLGGTTNTGQGFPIGFSFYFNGYLFDRVAVCADGWISLGQSWEPVPVNIVSSSYVAPLGSTTGINPPWLVSRIAGLAGNLQAQTGATLRLETIGTQPYRVLVVQWKNYRKYNASGDSFNFQIRLEETTNKVAVVFGNLTCNATALNAQVGFRGEPANAATNYRNRSTLTDWTSTTEGAAVTSTCTLSSTVYPPSGTTFTWTPPAAMSSSYTVGAGGFFTTLTAAIEFLNSNYPSYGIPEGGTVFNLTAGQTFEEAPPAITATGAAGRQITFQKSGTGADPIILVPGATATTDACFRLNGGDHFVFRDLDIRNATSTTALEIGFYLVPSAYNGCHDNLFVDCEITLSRTNANTKGVYSYYVSTAPSNRNTFDGLAITDCYQGFNLSGYSSAGTHHDDNVVTGCVLTDIASTGIYFTYCTDLALSHNQISMCAGNAVSFNGIYSTGTASTTAEVSYNTITGNTTSTTANGIYADDGTVSWHHNTVHGFTGTGTSNRIGIYIYDRNHEVFANEVYDINGAGHTYGIALSSYADAVSVYGNEIHDIKCTCLATSGYTATGISVYGTTVTVANNMIYDIGSTGDTAPMIRGITTGTGTTFNIYYNTIYLKGGGTATFGSAGLYLYSSGPALDIRNNIVVDLSTPGTNAAGRAVAVWKAYSGFAYYSEFTDRNIYYAGTPGPKNMICYDNGTVYQTLLDYKNAVGTRELGSLTESVPFLSVEDPYDVHINPAVATLAEANALPVTGWDLDFDGNSRSDTTPDIGADEGNFIVPAIAPDPAALISPLDTAIVIRPSATLNWSAAATGGVPTGYYLYFGTNYPPSNLANGTDLGNSTSYDPSPDMAFLTTYYWRIVPYNAVGVTPVANCPVWSFTTHAAPLTGNYIIGSTGTYPTYTLAITHLNAAGVGAGGVSFSGIAGEVFAENPPAITATGTAENPILFTRTGDGANPLITPTGGDETFAIRIDGGDYITFEYTDVANAGSATNLEYGYWIRGVSGDGPNHDTIRLCGITLNRAITSTGIYVSGVSGTGTSTGLSILNNAIDNASQGLYLDPYTEAYDLLAQGNTITNATLFGIFHDNGTDSQILDNEISFPASTVSGLVGIRATNLVNGLISGNTVGGGYSSANAIGLSQSGGTCTWSYNTVSGLSCEDGLEGFDGIGGIATIHHNSFSALQSSLNTVYGLELSFENTGTGIAYNNSIHDLSTGATGAQYVQGILSSGNNNKLYNNMIYDLRNPGGSTANQVTGINVSGGTAQLYYNTVHLNAAGTNASFSTAALAIGGASSVLMNNNIFVNASVPGSAGRAVAFWKSANGFANLNVNTDKNIYRAGTPGTQNLICYTPEIVYETLDAYKAATATFDQNSLTEAVPFVSATDVHITPGAPTLAEGNALVIADVSADFDDDPRNFATPDIGADEGTFQVPALIPAPAVLVSPVVAEYAVSIVPTFTWYASAAGGTPTGYRLYFGSNNPPTNLVNGLDLGDVLTWTSTFTLDYLTTYYWKIVPYNGNGPATGCPVWSFSTHQVPLTGNWIIGSSGYYPDFTHAIKYLNASGVGSGGVSFQAIAGEVFAENPPAITATGTASDPVSFTSTNTAATNPKITPTGGAGTFGIKIYGGDFITFDHIDIANAAGSTTLVYGYWLESPTGNGCTDNTIQNCAVTLNATTQGTACIRSDSTSGRVNHRNRYLNNTLANSRSGIYLYDSSAVNSSQVQGNVITGVTDIGIYQRTSNNIVISGNSITMAAANTRNFYGINCYNDSGTGQIHGNTITGTTTSMEFTGIYTTFTPYNVYENTITGVTAGRTIYGIQNYYGGANSYHDNTISNLAITSASYAIYGISGSSASIFANTVTGLNGAGQVRGITASSGIVYRNRVHNLQSTATANTLIGIYLAGTITAYDNFVYDLRNSASSTLPQVRGIHINGTASVYFNTVMLTSTGSAASFSTTPVYLQGGSSIKLINNIFSDRSVPGASGKSVAFWKEDAGFAELSAETDRNIWYAGTPGSQHLVCYAGTLAYPSLEDYKTANLGMEQNSFTELTPFASAVSPYDPHLGATVQTYAESNAQPLAAVTVDFDNQPRHETRPDIGADEGTFTPVLAAPAVPAYLSPANGAANQALNLALSWAPGSGSGMPDYYNVYLGTTTPPPSVATNVTATEHYPTLLPNTTYYWKVDAVNTIDTATGPIWSFTTRTDATIMEYPFLESFEVGNTAGSTSINRWTQALGSGSNYWTVNSSASYNRAPRTGAYNLTLRDGGDAWLFRPIYLEADQMYELELWARQYTASGAQGFIQVRFGTAASVASMTQTVINIQEFVNGAYQRGSAVFTAPSTGIWYLGIHGTCTNYVNYLSLDDICISFYTPTPLFSVSPQSHNFGMVATGTVSPSQGFTITNLGDSDLIISQADILLTGDNADEFALTDPGSDITLGPDASQTLYVSFAPLSLGSKAAALQITDNSPQRALHLIPLSGRGIGPFIPPFEEDFEAGWTDWVLINGTQSNKWELGSAAPYRNSYSAYISANLGASYGYNPNFGSWSHIFHDITFPSDVGGLKLKFNWKCAGETGFDYLSVHVADNSFVPVAGEYFTTGQLGGALVNQPNWQLFSWDIDPAWAGQTKRLIFSWHNDGGGGTQPPAAIDNIRVHGAWPALAAPQNAGGFYAGPNTVGVSWDPVENALDYIIEEADMYDGSYSYVGRSGNPSWTWPGSYARRFFRVRATD